ncbi:hypothetical protein AB1388_41280, partial [Streptomyces hydrogenans]
MTVTGSIGQRVTGTDDGSGGAGAVAAGPPVLYGREAELAAVSQLLWPASEVPADGRVVCVAGGPGEGRSALLTRAARDFPGEAHVVGAPGRQVPWSGARALLAALAPSGAAGSRAARLARGPEGIAAALASLVPGRGPVLLCLDDF